ncbi:MAG: signal peptide peptidase SppA [Planctomycetes bacterium]|nr:signal peptide peptidase SppA [Planctomycetota bacterium]MBL7008027.1 signal peptide peptidase SppA [Planctomycetota bacterium]
MKAFLRNFFATIFGVLAALALLAVAGAALLLHEPRLDLERGTILTVDLSMAVTDRGSSPSPQEVILEGTADSLELRRVRQALFAAAEDNHIAAVFLRGDAAAGTATYEALREGLAACADAGKATVAFLDQPGEGELYLASICDEVYVPPLALIEFNGLALSMMFYRDLLDLIGVEIQVTRVGKYKSAVEPFLLNEMSEANREQLAKLAGDLSDVLFGGIAAGRGLELEAVRSLAAASGFLSPEQAIEAGLIDGVLAFDEVLARLAELTDGDSGDLVQVTLEQYFAVADREAAQAADDPYEPSGAVAVVYAEGDILDGEDHDQVGGDTVARQLRQARIDPDVDAVVLRVNSPGGSAFASETILREVRLLKEAKPLVVSMGDVAASGGYWISCLADEIWARPGTITGSIGVFGMFPNAAELLDELGVSPQTVKTGEHADMNSLWRPKTESELALLQAEVDFIYEAFLDRVVEGRGLQREAVHELAQGRVWSGTAALELGLVDQLGGLEDAIQAAAGRASLGADFEVQWPESPGSLIDRILDQFEPGDAPLSRLSPYLEAARKAQRLATTTGVQARMPWLVVG